MTGVLGVVPQAWADLEGALRSRRPVFVYYHGRRRLICPHALGWKEGRPMLLGYQTGGQTSTGRCRPTPTSTGAASSSTRSKTWWRPTKRRHGGPPPTTTLPAPSTPSTTCRLPSPPSRRSLIRYYAASAGKVCPTRAHGALSGASQVTPARGGGSVLRQASVPVAPPPHGLRGVRSRLLRGALRPKWP
jgi:hypothetical protein